MWAAGHRQPPSAPGLPREWYPTLPTHPATRAYLAWIRREAQRDARLEQGDAWQALTGPHGRPSQMPARQLERLHTLAALFSRALLGAWASRQHRQQPGPYSRTLRAHAFTLRPARRPVVLQLRTDAVLTAAPPTRGPGLRAA